MTFDIYNLSMYGNLQEGVGSVVREFIVEAILPLLNFIFYISANRDLIFGNGHIQDKTLDTFLSSSLNVELVYAILTSITEFVKIRQFWADHGSIYVTTEDDASLPKQH